MGYKLIEKEIRVRLGNIRHSLHALEEQINEGLTAEDVDSALKRGFELIEDYPNDPRGHSCLLLSWKGKTPVHVVCAPHEDTLVIITTYIPEEEEWYKGYKKRREI
ncbi:MAG: DUF4258 domain-containing protein [Candidatus Hydrothermarchaeaceae archaeon]